MKSVETVVFHETSGYPSYQSSQSFVEKYLCLTDEWSWVKPKLGPPPVPGLWHRADRGIGPQYYVDGNGTVFALVGEYELGSKPRITNHAGLLNYTSIGIENGDLGDHSAHKPDLRPNNNAAGPCFFRLKLNDPDLANSEDLPGLVLFAMLLPHGKPDLVLVWFAKQLSNTAIPDYPGSGDTDHIVTRYPRWANMIFTERDYRSLALLSRLLAEQYGIPRAFPVLPYSKADTDGGDHTILRKLILTDERCVLLAVKLGLTLDDIKNSTSAFTKKDGPTMWKSYYSMRPFAFSFGNKLYSYRGFLSHALPGGHPCPGPMFDWHRVAREIWDWWWYPFDLDNSGIRLFLARREYMRARGTAHLREYYWDAEGTDTEHEALSVAAVDQARGMNNFALDASTPVYAVANGVIVAARLPNPAVADSPAFVLVRHEVFHQNVQGKIDYDHPPTVVWSLTTYLDCSKFAYDTLSTDNPDWLNRFVLRLTECKLAKAYKDAHQTTSANDKLYKAAWDFLPTSTGPRNTSGLDIEQDEAEYTNIVNLLKANNYARFPLEADVAPTTVRVILGDFLGTCGTLSNNASGTQVQIFSKDPLPVLNAGEGALAWAGEAWWKDISGRLDGGPENSLPGDAVVWQYPVTDFLNWVNALTWQSEWPKYGVLNADGSPAPATQRPMIRTIA